MPQLSITEKKKSDAGWEFAVFVGRGEDETKHEVFVPVDYYRNLTGGLVPPEKLVRRSFEFLLLRESKESILPEFELTVIQTYFPEYEIEIRKMLS